MMRSTVLFESSLLTLRPSPRRQAGTVIVLVVVTLVLMVLMIGGYVNLARTQRQTLDEPPTLEPVLAETVSLIQVRLLSDLFDENGVFFGVGVEPYDRAWTNPNDTTNATGFDGSSITTQGGVNDDRWLADATPYFNGTNWRWRKITTLTGLVFSTDSTGAADTIRNVPPLGPATSNGMAYSIATHEDVNVFDAALVDADLDGIPDSYYERAPLAAQDGYEFFVAVRIVDLGSMVDMNATSTALNGSGATVVGDSYRPWHPAEIDFGRYALRTDGGGTTFFTNGEVRDIVNYQTGQNPGLSRDDRLTFWSDTTDDTFSSGNDTFDLVDEIQLRYLGGRMLDPETSGQSALADPANLAMSSAFITTREDDNGVTAAEIDNYIFNSGQRMNPRLQMTTQSAEALFRIPLPGELIDFDGDGSFDAPTAARLKTNVAAAGFITDYRFAVDAGGPNLSNLQFSSRITDPILLGADNNERRNNATRITNDLDNSFDSMLELAATVRRVISGNYHDPALSGGGVLAAWQAGDESAGEPASQDTAGLRGNPLPRTGANSLSPAVPDLTTDFPSLPAGLYSVDSPAWNVDTGSGNRVLYGFDEFDLWAICYAACYQDYFDDDNLITVIDLDDLDDADDSDEDGTADGDAFSSPDGIPNALQDTTNMQVGDELDGVNEIFGFEPLPMLTEVYVQARYVSLVNSSGELGGAANTGAILDYHITWTRNDKVIGAGTQGDGSNETGYAIEIRNPYRYPISLEGVELYWFVDDGSGTNTPLMDTEIELTEGLDLNGDGVFTIDTGDDQSGGLNTDDDADDDGDQDLEDLATFARWRAANGTVTTLPADTSTSLAANETMVIYRNSGATNPTIIADEDAYEDVLDIAHDVIASDLVTGTFNTAADQLVNSTNNKLFAPLPAREDVEGYFAGATNLPDWPNDLGVALPPIGPGATDNPNGYTGTRREVVIELRAAVAPPTYFVDPGNTVAAPVLRSTNPNRIEELTYSRARSYTVPETFDYYELDYDPSINPIVDPTETYLQHASRGSGQRLQSLTLVDTLNGGAGSWISEEVQPEVPDDNVARGGFLRDADASGGESPVDTLGQADKTEVPGGDNAGALTTFTDEQLIHIGADRMRTLDPIAEMVMFSMRSNQTIGEVWRTVPTLPTEMDVFRLPYDSTLRLAGPGSFPSNAAYEEMTPNWNLPHLPFLLTQLTTYDSGAPIAGRINVNNAHSELNSVRPGFTVRRLLNWVAPIADAPTRTTFVSQLEAEIDDPSRFVAGDYNAGEMPGLASMWEMWDTVSDTLTTGGNTGDTSTIGTNSYEIDFLSPVDGIADDREEEGLLLGQMNQVLTTRSDAYVAYILIKAYRTDNFDTDPTPDGLSDPAAILRAVYLFDRSGVRSLSDLPVATELIRYDE